MRIQLGLFTVDGTYLVADWSTRVKSCHVRSNVHGYESCEAEIAVPFLEAFNYYQQLGPLQLKVNWGSYRIWEGRLEDPTQFAHSDVGLKLAALGGWVAYNDAPITGMWSLTDTSVWRPILTKESSSFLPDRFDMNTQNQLYIAARKNAILGNTTVLKLGSLAYVQPDQSINDIIGISFDYKLVTPAANWRALMATRNPDFTGIANQWTLSSAGAGTQVGTINVTFAAASVINFSLDFNAADAAFAGENGTCYLQIDNVRVVTSTAYRINTTLGTNIAAGTRTPSPASMDRIYVGQRLNISQGSATVGESVIVTAITASTFTAVFAFAHVIADTVTAHVVYPDKPIKDCVAVLNALNPTQVNDDTTLIQTQGVDVDQLIYEDTYPAEIISQMIAKSDNRATPLQWGAMVYDNQTLIVRPRGTGVAWYTDITSLDVVRTLTQLCNSVYAVYKDTENKRNLRTAISVDTFSSTKFQITRRKSIKTDTTNLVQANTARDSVLANQIDPIPRATVDLDRIFDIGGTPYPLFFMRADDTLTIRNFPPILSTTLYDKIRTLVITRVDVDMVANKVKLDLEVPMPDINVQLARALKGK